MFSVLPKKQSKGMWFC